MPNLKIFPTEAARNNCFQIASNHSLPNVVRLKVSDNYRVLFITAVADWKLAFTYEQTLNTRINSSLGEKTFQKKLLPIFKTICPDRSINDLMVDDSNAFNITPPNLRKMFSPNSVGKPIEQVDNTKRLGHIISFTNDKGKLAKPDIVGGCQI
jgi:hypothetical protein